jgi:hypothetical protein
MFGYDEFEHGKPSDPAANMCCSKHGRLVFASTSRLYKSCVHLTAAAEVVGIKRV